MSALAGMRPEHVAKFVKAVCGGDVHGARAASLSNAVTGALASASLGVSAIGVGLAQARGTNAKHGVKQADRLLSNGKLDVWEWFGLWVPHVVGARGDARGSGGVAGLDELRGGRPRGGGVVDVDGPSTAPHSSNPCSR